MSLISDLSAVNFGGRGELSATIPLAPNLRQLPFRPRKKDLAVPKFSGPEPSIPVIRSAELDRAI
jgi:hypothetical protein